MTSQMRSLPFINRYDSPEYVIYECFALAQRGGSPGVARRRRGLSSKVHLAAYTVCSDYPAAGVGRQALGR
jgi:hypothetical protein